MVLSLNSSFLPLPDPYPYPLDLTPIVEENEHSKNKSLVNTDLLQYISIKSGRCYGNLTAWLVAELSTEILVKGDERLDSNIPTLKNIPALKKENIIKMSSTRICLSDTFKIYCLFFSQLFNGYLSEEEMQDLFESHQLPNFSLQKMGKNLFYAAKLLSSCNSSENPQAVITKTLPFFLNLHRSEFFATELTKIENISSLGSLIGQILEAMEKKQLNKKILYNSFVSNLAKYLVKFQLKDFTIEEMLNFYYYLFNFNSIEQNNSNYNENSSNLEESNDIEAAAAESMNSAIDRVEKSLKEFNQILEILGAEAFKEWGDQFFSSHNKNFFDKDECFENLNLFTKERKLKNDQMAIDELEI